MYQEVAKASFFQAHNGNWTSYRRDISAMDSQATFSRLSKYPLALGPEDVSSQIKMLPREDGSLN
jgi:hypothetical protein